MKLNNGIAFHISVKVLTKKKLTTNVPLFHQPLKGISRSLNRSWSWNSFSNSSIASHCCITTGAVTHVIARECPNINQALVQKPSCKQTLFRMILLTEQLAKQVAWGLTYISFLTAILLPAEQARPRLLQWEIWDGGEEYASQMINLTSLRGMHPVFSWLSYKFDQLFIWK